MGQGSNASVDGDGQSVIGVRGLPVGTNTVDVTSVGSGGGPVEIRVYAQLEPVSLRVIGCETASLQITGGEHLKRLDVAGVGQAMTLAVSGGVNLAVLHLEDVACQLASPIDGLRDLELVGARWGAEYTPILDRLVVQGEVELTTEIETELLVLSGRDVLIKLRQMCTFGRIEALAGGSLTIQGGPGAGAYVSSVSGELTIDLSDVRVECLGRVGEINGCVFRGAGWLIFRRDCSNLVFDSADLSVRVEQSALWNASGVVGRLEAIEAIIQGASGNPLRPNHLGDLTGTEIDGADLSALPLDGSLDELAKARRVSLWLPGLQQMWKGQRKQASQDSSTIGKWAWRRNARYWGTMLKILEEGGAPGSTLSTVRLAQQRAHLRSISYRDDPRGWYIYRGYALLGYGEKTVQPLVVWVIGCGVIAAILNTSSLHYASDPFVKTLLRVMAAPLALFGWGIQPPNVPGVWDNILYAFGQVWGVTSLGTWILAVKRNAGAGKVSGS